MGVGDLGLCRGWKGKRERFRGQPSPLPSVIDDLDKVLEGFAVSRSREIGSVSAILEQSLGQIRQPTTLGQLEE
jgi:hypothetical protein